MSHISKNAACAYIECYLKMVKSKQALISFEVFVNISSCDDEAHLEPSDNYY